MTTLTVPARTAAPPLSLAATAAGVALLGSAAIHATVVSDHYEEWAAAGLFFVTLQAALALLGLAVLLVRSRPVAVVAMTVSAVTLGVWVLSRSLGMPFGPADMQAPEAVGAADLACGLLELATIGFLVPTALDLSERRRRALGPGARRTSTGVLGVAVVTAMLATTVVGLLPALSGESHHHAGSAPDH